MTDTHTHLYLKEYFPDGGSDAVRDAIDKGVNMMVLPSIDIESVEPLLSLHHKFPKNTAMAAGLHPTEVEADWKSELNEILDRFQGEDLVAIGEVGIDLYWDKTQITRQMDAFGYQLDLARSKDIPVIIHSRNAIDETLEVIRSFGSEKPALIFHSFTYGEKEADRILEEAEDSRFGFNGVITFKNAEDVRRAAALIGIDRIVAETDSPFLAPVPHRGKTNTSAYLPDVIKGIADSMGLDFEEAARLTTLNANQLFFQSKT